MDIYDYLEANSTVQERLLMLVDGDGLHWSQGLELWGAVIDKPAQRIPPLPRGLQPFNLVFRVISEQPEYC
jgi:hypothetical protein